MQTSLISVLAVSVLALLAPVLTSRLRPVVIPVAAMEVLLGIVFGRTGFGFLQPTAVTAFLSLFGLSYLMFLSGLEVDVVRLMRPSTADRRGLATAALTAVALLGAGILGGLELQRLGIVGNGLALGLLLGSSAPTVVLPTLKEGRRTGTQFGRTVLLVSLLLDVVGLLGVSVIAGLRAGGRPARSRPRRRPRYIAGLIPAASGKMPTDMAQTLGELAELIDQRATALASQAIQESQPWVRRLGPPPTDPTRRAAWEQQVRTIAAYRDRYGLTGGDPLGPAPSGQGQRLDYQRADTATRQAQATASDRAQHRRGPDQQIDSGRDLGR